MYHYLPTISEISYYTDCSLCTAAFPVHESLLTILKITCDNAWESLQPWDPIITAIFIKTFRTDATATVRRKCRWSTHPKSLPDVQKPFWEKQNKKKISKNKSDQMGEEGDRKRDVDHCHDQSYRNLPWSTEILKLDIVSVTSTPNDPFQRFLGRIFFQPFLNVWSYESAVGPVILCTSLYLHIPIVAYCNRGSTSAPICNALSQM